MQHINSNGIKIYINMKAQTKPFNIPLTLRRVQGSKVTLFRKGQCYISNSGKIRIGQYVCGDPENSIRGGVLKTFFVIKVFLRGLYGPPSMWVQLLLEGESVSVFLRKYIVTCDLPGVGSGPPCPPPPSGSLKFNQNIRICTMKGQGVHKVKPLTCIMVYTSFLLI